MDKRPVRDSLLLDSHFQPIYSLAHRRTVGMEALLRASENGEMLGPLQVYERYIRRDERVALDLAVCEAHCRRFADMSQQQRWLFLNVDAMTLSDAKQAAELGRIIRDSGIAPQSVVLEVLEQTIELDARLIEGIAVLREQGCLLAIDDFGVGHSNLDRVCSLEPDFVKFDRNLLRSAVTQQRTRNLLSRLVRLMHEIGALVVVEGVESDSDVVVALDSGCDLVQGFYVARPAAQPDADSLITPRLDAKWDELMNREMLRRKLNRRQLELSRQAFVQTAIALMQGSEFRFAAQPMMSLPDVIRCFLLDNEGRQKGPNLNVRQLSEEDNLRFAPLEDTTGAVWSRRSYFQHAIDQPGVLYMSEPYLSMTDTRTCVTLSMSIEIDDAMHVLCADVLLPR
ncbi:EAL domain-containing protein [Vogesella sp. LIG4]|uniref:sensor domain-containing phosphodiesterase n=1 Tax=Vogesella sp. LIG4 TaxID=1192162 RepID=UPI00081FE32E|nr:EAL domain-containing protein [Vogesella sp. LIG4]SCK14107.1 EAL domain, c-di-GMP-specific phosphodiesterase class I (or its enzymatically inactive variant) [Vogesella sp. LIG4]